MVSHFGDVALEGIEVEDQCRRRQFGTRTGFSDEILINETTGHAFLLAPYRFDGGHPRQAR